MQIRRLRQDDDDDVSELLEQLGYAVPIGEVTRRLERILASDTHFAAVAEVDGRVNGFVHADERPALERPCQAVLQASVVRSDARRLGIRKHLMRAAESWARSRGLEEVALHERQLRQVAQRIYESIGYSGVATSHLMIKSLESV